MIQTRKLHRYKINKSTLYGKQTCSQRVFPQVDWLFWGISKGVYDAFSRVINKLHVILLQR